LAGFAVKRWERSIPLTKDRQNRGKTALISIADAEIYPKGICADYSKKK